MAQDVKDLIEKINREGIEAAENNARKIEQDAKGEAARVLEKAGKEADKILAEAKDNIRLMEEKQRSLLDQAGRDLLLSLRAQITETLNRVILEKVHDVLTPQELSFLIGQMVKHLSAESRHEVVITLKREDLHAMEKHFLAGLKDELKKGVTLKASEDVLGGFFISFDSGKTQFDFTDRALAEYIGTYLKPKLADILSPAKK